MTLKRELLHRIASDGPLSLAEYMREALLHPQFGYYSTRDPFGVAGDFTTAPEISQMFGELLGLSLAQAWMDQGAPPQITLAELGPGRGTCMRDVLRAVRGVPGFQPDVVLIDASEKMRDVQRGTLAGHDVRWADRVEDLPDQPLFLIANEFFDALPIRQFRRDATGWREIRVGADGDDLVFGAGPDQAEPMLAHRLEDTAPGDIVETCPEAARIAGQIGAKIAQFGGAALLIDYGDWRSLGDTLQALHQHQPVHPLADPGHADLTAHVDFEAIANACAPARYSRVTPQGIFLERLGITARAQALARNLTGAALDAHIAAHRRLTHPDEMGNLFKVIGLYPDTAHPPPGLDP
ncbi:class I SAM-dependent methyltransferase [Aliishimia ponticola]|uniref:Class I SAM-dependent methyltransferase n=1 Tax=Aliishimia ponticola TaxID=2499833 RepID=A0A4S4NB99_9RHOB|nr:SAM-dependent methyltransferase [Aliishimia ponticola]THH35955.1 class I SAM-dependent methyltransferase [Aliishimia ponticola]